ncbi:hypothetical protein [Burkholderia ubonensis]|uniref:hypothetical protein n=1 Tax=Burkholderia ubonensis TaxID=101571 RepID=UPI00075DA311|nr:hypothetical protein [Burkholderia ubonensis]KWN75047.1 hypothetical protein WM23_26865 [Burkholderia ubonensis]
MKPTNRVVLFVDGRASLYLTGAHRDTDGKVVRGWVENGHWDFELRAGEVLAKAGNRIVTRTPDPGFTEWPAPRGYDYNAVMAKAQEEYDATH